ncbi:MAG TPA: hypothetical protein VGH42_06540 [Verrucomicrobiae bacterium]|jgi:hypothetical protein
MGKNDLLKIALGAIIAVVFKDFFSCLVRQSKPFATTAAKISGKWIWEHMAAIEFAIDFGSTILFAELFFIYPYDNSQVSYQGVRFQILLAAFIALQLCSSFWSFRRWIRR